MLDFLRKLFRPRNPRANRDVFQPMQTEPEEYLHWLGEFVFANHEGRLRRVVLAVGFDRSEFARVRKQVNALGLNCTSVRAGPDFQRRNPVLVCRYSRETESGSIVTDCRKFHKIGATDISAVGITMETAQHLREIFGIGCCPVLAASVQRRFILNRLK